MFKLFVKAPAIVAGVALVACVTTVDVVAGGGFAAPASWVLIAVAIGWVVSAMTISRVWAANCALAIGLVVAVVTGECLQLLATADRLLAHRVAEQARISAALKGSAKAALANVVTPPSATPLADRLGVHASVVDLAHSGLGPVASNLLAFLLIAAGAHPTRNKGGRPRGSRNADKRLDEPAAAPVKRKRATKPEPETEEPKPKRRARVKRLGSSPLPTNVFAFTP
jgi:hypothetical protein